MAQKYLGDTIDLHGGGEDLRFPHHKCEIAQAEAITNKPFANHWAHTRFLKVEGEKMSKRHGNFLTVHDLTGVVDTGEAFSGFGHPATVIIALVLIVSRGLSNTGAIEYLARLVMAGSTWMAPSGEGDTVGSF